MINLEFLFVIACFFIFLSVMATLIIICKMLTICAINNDLNDTENSIREEIDKLDTSLENHFQRIQTIEGKLRNSLDMS